jgi:hypothetical protein
MSRITLLPALLLILPIGAQADVVRPDGSVIECYCTDSSGARVEMGESICLNVGGRMFTAQCQMSLNVPMWRETQNGCATSSLNLPVTPFDPDTLQQPVKSGLVYPQI